MAPGVEPGLAAYKAAVLTAELDHQKRHPIGMPHCNKSSDRFLCVNLDNNAGVHVFNLSYVLTCTFTDIRNWPPATTCEGVMLIDSILIDIY